MDAVGNAYVAELTDSINYPIGGTGQAALAGNLWSRIRAQKAGAQNSGAIVSGFEREDSFGGGEEETVAAAADRNRARGWSDSRRARTGWEVGRKSSGFSGVERQEVCWPSSLHTWLREQTMRDIAAAAIRMPGKYQRNRGRICMTD